MHNKRRHAREETGIPIFYYARRRDGESVRRVYYPGTILDRCPGGLGLLVAYPHQSDEELWFESLRGRDTQPVAGRIRWVCPENGGYRLGVALEEKIA